MADLDALSSHELHDRAVRLAVHRGDLRFLWKLLGEIPAARSTLGDAEGGAADATQIMALLGDFAHAGQGEIAEALRPVYLGYLDEHDNG